MAIAHTLSNKTVSTLLLTMSLACTSLQAEMIPMETEPLLLLNADEQTISIATGTVKPIHLAPSVATVITAEEIKAIGARFLEDVLEFVPGLHVGLSWNRFKPIYSIRGIHTANNPQILLMIDGDVIKEPFDASRPQLFRLPVSNIARIEIIRGPGSAIYGADALSGVINVITKDNAMLGGTTIGGRSGSFDSQDVWLQHGDRYGNWDLALSIEYNTSDGDRQRIIDSDLQTVLDNTFGTSASLAPGSTNTSYEQLTNSVKLSRDAWQLSLYNWHLFDAGVGAGVAGALDPVGHQVYDLTKLAVENRINHLTPATSLETRVAYTQSDQQVYFQLFPPGALLPVGDDGNAFTPGGGYALFSDGYHGNPGGESRLGFFETALVYEGLDRHRLRLALGLTYEQGLPKETKNFGPGIIDGTSLSSDLNNPTIIDGSLTNITGKYGVFMKETTRQTRFIALQDEWRLAPDWELTAGVRYDHYSDFGDTTNPRLALVWATDYNLTTKLLYGRAFHAPGFGELHVEHNPSYIGNPNLKPETINTTELVFDYRPVFDLQTTVNLYRYQMRDLIDIVNNRAENAKEQDGHGIEADIRWRINNTLRLNTNYSWQHSVDAQSGAAVPDAPARQASLRLGYQLNERCSINPQTHWVAGRSRTPGDTREAIADYTIVDLTYRCDMKHYPIEWAASVRNAFDQDAREPATASVPNDYPLEGRSVYLEASYHFDH